MITDLHNNQLQIRAKCDTAMSEKEIEWNKLFDMARRKEM